MLKNAVYHVKSNQKIANDVYLMRLCGPTDAFERPGQFVNIHVSGFYLRRPISVCDWDDLGFEIIYKVVGRGTATLAQFAPGTELDILVGLGNGFTVEQASGKQTVLIGGGVGVPPLYGLAQKMIESTGVAPIISLGFSTKQEVFYTQEFQKLGCEVLLSTNDGSTGVKGVVTDLLRNRKYDYYYACGPQPMLRAVWKLGRQKSADGQLSFEERMGCGFGACMGCSCETLVGAKRICVDGPVFSSKEVELQ